MCDPKELTIGPCEQNTTKFWTLYWTEIHNKAKPCELNFVPIWGFGSELFANCEDVKLKFSRNVWWGESGALRGTTHYFCDFLDLMPNKYQNLKFLPYLAWNSKICKKLQTWENATSTWMFQVNNTFWKQFLEFQIFF